MPPLIRVVVRDTKVRAATARTFSTSRSAASTVLKVIWMRASAHGATALAEFPPLMSPVLTMVYACASTKASRATILCASSRMAEAPSS